MTKLKTKTSFTNKLMPWKTIQAWKTNLFKTSAEEFWSSKVSIGNVNLILTFKLLLKLTNFRRLPCLNNLTFMSLLNWSTCQVIKRRKRTSKLLNVFLKGPLKPKTYTWASKQSTTWHWELSSRQGLTLRWKISKLSSLKSLARLMIKIKFSWSNGIKWT